MTSQHNKAKRWRPWQFWQFSLRTLLLIMLGVACFLGGWAANEWKLQRELERAQQEAEAEMRAAMQFLTQPSPPIPTAGSNGVE